MSVGIKSNNGSRGSLDAIYISKGRLGRGNTDWIDRCKGTFTLLTRVGEEFASRTINERPGLLWNASTRSWVDRLLNRFDRTSPNVVLQTCYRDTKLNKFPKNEQFNFLENLKPIFYFVSNGDADKKLLSVFIVEGNISFLLFFVVIFKYSKSGIV